jgi:hypothetical protein
VARLLAEDVPESEAPRLGRALRRTRRLVDRQLAALAPPPPPDGR